MDSYTNFFAGQLGMPVWLFVLVTIWTLIWTLLALWKAARKKHLAWFIILGVLNTLGILEILYLYLFSNIEKPKKDKSSKKKKLLRKNN